MAPFQTIAACVAASVFLISCGASSQTTITRSQLGDQWPLTVEEVTPYCYDSLYSSNHVALVVEANGWKYTLNGTAKTQFPELRGIDEIWADSGDELAPKKNIGPLMDAVRASCDN